MKKILLLIVILIMPQLINSQGLPEPSAALEMLREGNARFLSGASIHPRIDKERRNFTTENGQHPYVTIITCSDSRVPLTVIFDQGIGDIFEIKVAGNVCDVDEIASIEYGAGHLHTPLLVVLGHTKCGAVTAVCKGEEVHGSIPQLVDNIIPAVNKAKHDEPELQGEDLINAAIKANVFQSLDDLLKNSKEIRTLIKEGKLLAIGAIYDINSGLVEWLGHHPQQEKMLGEYKGDGGHKAEAHGAAADSHGASEQMLSSNSINIIVLIGIVVISTGLVIFGVWGFMVFLRRK